MKSLIGGSTKYQDLESELHNLKIAGYDYAELDLGFLIEPNKAFRDKLKTLKNIIPILSGHLPEIDYEKEDIERCKKIYRNIIQSGNKFICNTFI